MAEGRGSSLLYSLRLISLGLRLTASLPGQLQSSRTGAGSPAPARPDHPRGAPTSAPPSGSRSSRACALAPPTAAPPRSCPDSESPAPLLGGHVAPGPGGGRGCASHLRGVVTPEEFASPLAVSLRAGAALPVGAPAPVLCHKQPLTSRCGPRLDRALPQACSLQPEPRLLACPATPAQHRTWHTIDSMNRQKKAFLGFLWRAAVPCAWVRRK